MRTNTIIGLVSICGLAGAASAQISFSAEPSITTPARPGGIAALDFDHDGRLDLAITSDNPDRVMLYRNTGPGFALVQTLPLGNGVGANTVAAADFDGDGWTDLAVAEPGASRIQIVRNSAGTLVLGPVIAAGTDTRAIRTADFNGDSRPDLVTANRDGDSATVALNLAGGWSASTYPVGDEPRTVAAIDVDGNGALDLIVTNHRSRNASLLRNDGAGGFTAWATIPTGGAMRPDGVDSGDLNGDGLADFVVTQDNNGIGFVSVFLNQGGGAFSGPTNIATGGVNPSDVLLRDLDRDGKLDATIANEDGADATVLTGNGAGGLAVSLTLPAGTRPDSLILADLSGDGKLDIALTNRDSSTVSIYLNTTPSGPCAADFNQDGFVDFLDFSAFTDAFEGGAASADFNQDGFIDFFDFSDFVAAFEAGC